MALLPLLIIDVSNASEDTSVLAVGDYIDFKASATTFGRLSSTGFAGSGAPIATNYKIKLSVKLATAVLISFEYAIVGSAGLTMLYTYLPLCTTETDFWLDNHGNTFSDSLLTTPVDGTATLTQGLETESEYVSQDSGTTESIEVESDLNMVITIAQIEALSVGSAIEQRLYTSFSTIIAIQQVWEQIVNRIASDVRLGMSFEQVKNLTKIHEISVASTIDNLIRKVINTIVASNDVFDAVKQDEEAWQSYTYLKQIVEGEQSVSKLIESDLDVVSTFLNKVQLYIVQHMGMNDSIVVPLEFYTTYEPIYTAFFKTGSFNIGNTSMKLLSGVKLYGNIPIGTQLALEFYIKGTNRKTSYIDVMPNQIAYFNVQGESFKLWFRVLDEPSLAINFYEVFWKSPDKTNIRSTLYYGT